MDTDIHMATEDDADDILKIYAPYVNDTSISFETEVPSLEDFKNRMKNILKQYPFLVCECEGKIVGYAYASRHSERAAYLYSVDVSVYVLAEYHRKGIGRKLYEFLFKLLKNQGYYTTYAGITLPNGNSVGLHTALGFKPVGIYHNVGYKHGKWHDIMWLERPLRDYNERPTRNET